MPQVKNWITGETILEYEGELKTAIVEAVQAGKMFMNADLSGSDLSGSNLSGSNLSGSNLRGSNLLGSNLSYSNLRGSDLSGSDLSGSDLSYSNLRYSNLSGSNLRGSSLSGSDLRGSNLRGSNLSYSDLSGSDLRGHPIVVGGLRSDGYQFLLTNFPEQGVRILAGCRDFTGAEQAREHWTAKGGMLGAESLAILDHMLNLARIRGIVTDELTVVPEIARSNGKPKKPAKRATKKKPARKKVAAKK